MKDQADARLSCVAMQAEVDGNKERIAHLRSEDGNAQGFNFVVAATAVALSPAVFLLADVSDAEQVEAKALHNRNARLEALKVARGCHVKPNNVPPNYSFVARTQRIYIDGSGRRMSITANRFVTNDPIRPTQGAFLETLGYRSAPVDGAN